MISKASPHRKHFQIRMRSTTSYIHSTYTYTYTYIHTHSTLPGILTHRQIWPNYCSGTLKKKKRRLTSNAHSSKACASSIYTMAKSATFENFWDSLRKCCRPAMNGGQEQLPKLSTNGLPRRTSLLSCVTSLLFASTRRASGNFSPVLAPLFVSIHHTLHSIFIIGGFSIVSHITSRCTGGSFAR